MLVGIEIDNFRSFDHLSLDKLGTINIITGKNNTGKSTILEALFLLNGYGNPELGLNLNIMRGQTVYNSNDFLLDYFHGFEGNSKIRLRGKWSDGHNSQLEISRRNKPEIEIDFDTTTTEPPSTQPSIDSEIVFRYNVNQETTEIREGSASIAEKGFKFKHPEGKALGPQAIYLSSNITFNNSEYAARVSKGIAEKKRDVLVEALKIINPNISDIIISYEGERPNILADIGLSKYVPIALLGGGTLNMLKIISSLVDVRDGILFIDEIENGFHHSVLVDVWKVLGATSRKFRSQLFVVTHSYECIAAAVTAFKDMEAVTAFKDMKMEYYKIIRIEKSGDKINIVDIPAELVKTSTEMNLELR